MGDISSAIAEAIRNRAASTTLVTYSFFWLAWHWEGVFVALFTSEEIIYEKFHGLLKNEYLAQYFFGWHGWQTVFGFAGPFILTVLFIWPFQKYAFILAYEQEQKSKTERRKVKLRQEREVEEYKTTLLVKESQKIDAEAKKVESETKLSRTKKRAAKTDPTILWDEDYEKFKKSRFFKDFNRIIEAVYRYNGSYVLDVYGQGVKVGSELLAFADTEELVIIDQKVKRISLTLKGKHFVKRYQQEIPLG